MTRPAGILLFLMVFAGFLISPASAQLALYTVQGAVETPVGSTFDFGSVATGDASDVIFRLRNPGNKLMYLTFLSVSGMDFSNPGRPLLPAPINVGDKLDITVHFQPDQPGSYSATLQMNEISAILVAKGIPGLVVLLNNQPLGSGQALSFGEVQVGSAQTLKLMLANKTAQPLTVPVIAIQGSTFRVAGSATSGAMVAAGSVAELDVTFSPDVSGSKQGSLAIGQRSFPLQGTGVAAPPPELPKPAIQLDIPATASAKQGKLSINLPSASPASAGGTVKLEFQPAVTGADDPAVTFADGTRSAAFTIAKGAAAAQFGGQPDIQFGTGTTAGKLVFNAELGSNTVQTSVTIPPAPVGFDAAVAVRNVACVPVDLYCTGTNVEVQINGWDNSRSASQVVFRFFDSAGNPIAPGDIPFDGTAKFQQYFGSSTLGGVFALHALFPVTGNSDTVTAAEVQLTNSAGTARSARIQF